MTPAAAPAAEADLRRTARGVAALFFANGAAFASWIPRIPEIRDRLDLDVGTLGLTLTGGAIGGMIGSALAGRAVHRSGSRLVALVGGGAVAVGLPLVAVAPAAWALAGVLVLLGVCDALADISMNAQAVQVQTGLGRSVINRFHAGWSLGTLVGALVASAAAARSVPIGWHLATVSVLLVAVLAWSGPRLLRGDSEHAPADATRREGQGLRAVAAVLAVTAFASAVVEGTPGDWSALFLTDVLDASPGAAGLAYAAFTAMMLAGRLAADPVVDRHGPVRVGHLATAVTAVGVVTVTAAGAVPVGIVGFGLLGLGVAVLFPMLYLEAGTLPGVRSGTGLAVMSIGARLGFLVAPVLVGSVASRTSLRAGLGLVVGTALVIATASRAVLHRLR